MNRTLRLLRAALTPVCLLACLLGSGLVASAQTTTITATKLRAAGFLISTGEVLLTPVNTIGTPIAFADGTGAQNGPVAFACQIVAGVITGALTETNTVSGVCSVPDATQTIPANILYSIQVIDQSTGLRTSGAAYTLQAVIGVSGTTWALDHYGPPASTSNIQAVQAVQGATLPISCVAPSIFTNTTTNTFSTCVGGVFVAVGGSTISITTVGSSGPATLLAGVLNIPQYTGGSSLSVGTTAVTAGTTGYCLTNVGGLLQNQPCGGVVTPPLTYTYLPAAVSDNGTAFASGFTRYSTNMPQAGSVNAATSTIGYLSFNPTPSVPQYAERTVIMPPYWTTASMMLQFYSTVTVGNSVMNIQTACVTANQVVGVPTFSTDIITTTAVSATAGGNVQTALIANIATPGLNGCPAIGMTTPTQVTIRLYANSTSAVQTYLTGATLIVGRSQ
jgi:hypothetical protein